MIYNLLTSACLTALIQATPPKTNRVPVLDSRIVGGEPTVIEKHPYQVSLQLLSHHRCGGVIISKDYVLTAGHCTDYMYPEELTIRAGSTFYNSGGVVKQVAEFFQHPSFNWGTLDYDITILLLASPLCFGTTISPARLPPSNQVVVAGEPCEASGWGVLVEGGSSPIELYTVQMSIVDQKICKAAYGGNRVTDRMLCAGAPEEGKASCHGDSGGPLIVNGTLIGLVSWSYGCPEVPYPGVYSSIPALRDYITEITGL